MTSRLPEGPKASPEHAVPDDVLLRLADAVEYFHLEGCSDVGPVCPLEVRDVPLRVGDLKVLLEAVRSLPRESVVSSPTDEERERLAQFMDTHEQDANVEAQLRRSGIRPSDAEFYEREAANYRAIASLLRASR